MLLKQFGWLTDDSEIKNDLFIIIMKEQVISDISPLAADPNIKPLNRGNSLGT